MLSELTRLSKAAFLRANLIIYYPIQILYFWIVKNIINSFGGHKLHLTKIGEFTSGVTKTRSIYREDMLLRTLLLFVNIRGKSCLDLACNDGFWSFRLGTFGIRRLTGVDGYKPVITRANFLKTVYNFRSFHFVHQYISSFLYQYNKETYDIILLLSILYHLPEKTDWPRFFEVISKINNECLVIDSRWFEDDAYYYDKTSLGQAILKTAEGVINKWRPKRKEIFIYLKEFGYEQVIEINPSAFLTDIQEAYGNGDPYTLENVADYITDHRTIIIAYKNKSKLPDTGKRLSVKNINLKELE
jgi:2-polyprenyl-3-methyl-5-hydroxy-6-metoxy-1,4-benzoquinol methylase